MSALRQRQPLPLDTRRAIWDRIWDRLLAPPEGNRDRADPSECDANSDGDRGVRDGKGGR